MTIDTDTLSAPGLRGRHSSSPDSLPWSDLARATQVLVRHGDTKGVQTALDSRPHQALPIDTHGDASRTPSGTADRTGAQRGTVTTARNAKRLSDVAIATAALAVCAPLLLLVALAVLLSSGGPIIYRQTRVGAGGRVFTILKFRTMRRGTNDQVRRDPELWASYVANDYKLPANAGHQTSIGRLLRKSSLDELPQFWNVLRGDMSIVGVRPLVEHEFASRPEESRKLYATMAPGMTGLWQVTGRSGVRSGDRVALDDEYISLWSWRMDVDIILRTPAALLRTRASQ